ncbi:MAG: MFS transporter [Euryarchaeota archaeon]|jgi:EmrB/QacA subfamily drug resistance transporter|nr:MFS transporter [Euryarchaeota archaeon]MBT3970930.1 MFS transporter [Euryarchaeota archaeon]MBT4406946.1 MFS transporter [Euryarchaeota archaeon]MBT6645866.1 MFS transporter [Euryarchaeota archaeon]
MNELHTSHNHRWIILMIMSLSLMIVMINNVTLNVALPELSTDLGADNTQLQWIIDAYALAFGGSLLLMGALGDRFGRKGALQVGLVIVAISAWWTSQFATTAEHVIAARAFMGFGAALVMPATLSIIIVVFPKNERGKAIGIWAAMAGVGAPLGLVVGGYLIENYQWQTVFLVNVPVIIMALLMGIKFVPKSRELEKKPLDWMGAFLSIISLSTLLFAIIEGPELGWTNVKVLGIASLSLVSAIAFVLWEKRVSHPILPLSFFSNKGYTVGLIAIGLSFFVMFSFMYMLMLNFQLVRGLSPLAAAIHFVPLPLGLMPAAANSERLVTKFGSNKVVGTGLLIVAIALLTFTQITVSTSFLNIGLMLWLLGTGMGLTMAPSTTVVMDSIPEDKSGVGSATNDASREIGGALGVAIGGSVLNEIYRSTINIPLELESKSTLIEQSFPGAIRLGNQLIQQGNPIGQTLIENAQIAFVEGMAASSLVAACIAFIASFIAFAKMPKKTNQLNEGEE